MTSRFPDSDTFLNHFEDLLTHFMPPLYLSWSQVFVVEYDSIIGEIPELISKSALIPANEYEKRFDELLNIGYDWINMHAKGILNNFFIVEIEYPNKSINAPRNKISVNYSGPATYDNQPRWDLSSLVKVLE